MARTRSSTPFDGRINQDRLNGECRSQVNPSSSKEPTNEDNQTGHRKSKRIAQKKEAQGSLAIMGPAHPKTAAGTKKAAGASKKPTGVKNKQSKTRSTAIDAHRTPKSGNKKHLGRSSSPPAPPRKTPKPAAINSPEISQDEDIIVDLKENTLNAFKEKSDDENQGLFGPGPSKREPLGAVTGPVTQDTLPLTSIQRDITSYNNLATDASHFEQEQSLASALGLAPPAFQKVIEAAQYEPDALYDCELDSDPMYGLLSSSATVLLHVLSPGLYKNFDSTSLDRLRILQGPSSLTHLAELMDADAGTITVMDSEILIQRAYPRGLPMEIETLRQQPGKFDTAVKHALLALNVETLTATILFRSTLSCEDRMVMVVFLNQLVRWVLHVEGHPAASNEDKQLCLTAARVLILALEAVFLQRIQIWTEAMLTDRKFRTAAFAVALLDLIPGTVADSEAVGTAFSAACEMNIPRFNWCRAFYHKMGEFVE